MNEPPGARARVALSGLTIAEYFRDEMGQDVMLFVDNIFRFTQAGSEVSALLGRIPSAVGYQPTLATEMGALQERITTTNKGSITSVQAIYVPADDLTDPAPATTFAHLDATTVLSRAHRRDRHLPGGRPARLDQPHPRPPGRRSGATTRWPAKCSRSSRSTRSCRTSSPSSAWTSSRGGQADRRSRPPDGAFLSQPFDVAKVFTGADGKYVDLADTIRASKRSSTASTTSCPRTRSTWSAASKRSSRRPASSPRRKKRSSASRRPSRRPGAPEPGLRRHGEQ
jgi:hypothetical protein